MSDYYDWEKTLSHTESKIFAVISIRGAGKTYGIRKKAIQKAIKDGSTFVELCRYKIELKDVSKTYFNKLVEKNEFPNHVFKVEGTTGYIADKPRNDEDKPRWRELVYFVALSTQQRMKKNTFANVAYVIFDEFLIPKYKIPGYLYNEYSEFLNILDTIIREVPGEGTSIKICLLGNPEGGIVNPYFAAWGINEPPEYGYKYTKNKLVLIHNVEPGEYAEQKAGTLVGRLAKGTNAENVMATNVFKDATDDFISKKSKDAKFELGFVYRGSRFGLWYSDVNAYYYVSNKVPANSEKPIYALTANDNRINYVMAERNSNVLRSFAKLYCAGCIMFENQNIKEQFLKVLTLFGVR